MQTCFVPWIVFLRLSIDLSMIRKIWTIMNRSCDRWDDWRQDTSVQLLYWISLDWTPCTTFIRTRNVWSSFLQRMHDASPQPVQNPLRALGLCCWPFFELFFSTVGLSLTFPWLGGEYSTPLILISGCVKKPHLPSNTLPGLARIILTALPNLLVKRICRPRPRSGRLL